MKAVGSTLAVWATVVAATWSWPLPVEAATKAEKARIAAKLVEDTLLREAREGIDNRAELLKPALEQKPPYEAAWWQSGFIYDVKRREWLLLDEVQQLAAKDDRLAAYRKTREKYPTTIDGQIALARWCRKYKLEDQMRAHLTQVLEFDPDHAEARQYLGFRSVNGTWVDDHDIAEAQTFTRKASTAAAKWGPRLEKLRDRLASDNAREREKVQGELMELRDPEAVGAIDVVFCRQSSEMALLGIELLKNIQAPQAAGVLAWHTVFSPWPQARLAAATALRSQEKQDYVPLLLEAAQRPIEPQTPVAGNSSSQNVRMLYRLNRSVSTYSYNTTEHLKEHPYWQEDPQRRFDPNSPDPVAKKTTETVNEGGKRYTIQKREYYTVRGDRLQDRRTENKVTVEANTITPMRSYVYPRNSQVTPYQQQSDAIARKAAPYNALAEATGEKGLNTPSQWWDWWYDYNEVYLPSGKHTNAPDRPKLKTPASGEIQSQRGDCLAVGTLVQTETGPTAIEKVAVGDRIFCCDSETGCLALKPVLRKTARPEGRLLKIRAGGEEFEASGGHVFWVAGRGWVKARDLLEGMQLHTIRGTAPIESIELGTLQTTYSLVVADFHTYFVGKDKILTHDNTIRNPTNCIVPGLASHMVTK